MTSEYNASAWGHESILNFFDKKRLTTQHIYPSEWFFLKDKIADDMSLLDIGCAKGGMANVLA
jgi:cyclopropane fatty-acyl-phospholipid synthase-like methyltransferase